MSVFNDDKEYQDVVINTGTTFSNAVQLKRDTLVGVRIPSTFVAATEGPIRIQESQFEAGPFSTVNFLNAGASYSVTAGETLGIPANNAACARWVRIALQNAPAATRTLTLITRNLGG